MACSGRDKNDRLLAKVNEAELYFSDVETRFYNISNQEDSTLLMKSIVNNWIEEQVLLQEAYNLELEMDKTIQRKVEQFKNDLIIHSLMKQKIEEQLDTVVDQQEIEQYYKNNIQEFELQDYLVKVLYLKVASDAPEIDQITSAYKLKKEEDLETIQIYARMYASNFYYDPENWIYFDDLLKEVPLQDINKDKFIMNRSKIRFEENGYYYFLNVMDFKLKNTASPLSFEKNKIRERILSMRIKDLEIKIKEDILNNAYANEQIESY